MEEQNSGVLEENGSRILVLYIQEITEFLEDFQFWATNFVDEEARNNNESIHDRLIKSQEILEQTIPNRD
jgi:hypothetical protein